MKLKLYQYYNPYSFYTVEVLTTLSIEEARKFWDIWDNVNAEEHYLTLNNGKCKELHSIDEIPPNLKELIPFVTDEKLPFNVDPKLGGDYLDVECTIEEFFEEYYGKEF